MDFPERLRALVDEITGGNQSAFARICGLKEGSIRQYLTGTRPRLDHLVAISKGTNRSLDWLVYGEGPAPISDLNTNSPAVIDGEFLGRVHQVVASVHAEAEVKLPVGALLAEAAAAYNELVTQAEDPSDRDELESLLPWLEARLRKRLKKAREEPGTGKRLA